MNKADSEAGNRAVDSLINFETVKVRFNVLEIVNEKLWFFYNLVF